MIDGEGDKRETQRAYVCDDIVRAPGFLNITVCPFIGQQSDFGQQPARAAEVMRRSARRHARALGGGAQRKGFDAPLGDNVVGGFDERGAQVAVMISRSFFSHLTILLNAVQIYLDSVQIQG